MIKKYNQFIKENIEENLENSDTNMYLDNSDVVDEFNDDEEFDEEEEGDLYTMKLKELRDALGSKAILNDNSVEYRGKNITFPSEIEMYLIDNKKFRTVEEVVDYIKNNNN